MRLIICLVLFSTALTGCIDKMQHPKYEYNNELRTEVFLKCLDAIPAGPTHTKYNDWDEVVDECDTAAYYQTRTCVQFCN